MRWRLLRRLGALLGVTAMLVVAAPCAAADDGALLDAPTLSLADLGSGATVSFYGEISSTTLSFPVPAGLVPVTLNTTLDFPFNLRSGILTVMQDDRIISRLGVPLADLAPFVIPLDGVDVVNGSVTVTLKLTALPADGYCLDDSAAVNLIRGSVTYAGIEVAPRTIADFLPSILRAVTIAVPSTPTQAESDAAVQLATALASRYRSQDPRIALVALADGATTLDGPSLPMERQIIIKEGPDEGLSLVGDAGVPELLISGPPDKLKNQTRLLTDSSLGMAVSRKAVADKLHPNPWLPGNSATLAQLRQPAVTSVGFAPQVNIALDQTQFGHPTQGFRVHLLGSHTPVPAAFGAQLTASVGGEVIDTWSTDGGGTIDRWVDIPDRLLFRYTSLDVMVNTAGDAGRCNEFRPITLRIAGNSVVESSPAKPPIPPGFGSLPQALMPRMQVGIGANSFTDTVRAAQITVGLQKLSAVPLQTAVTTLSHALDSNDPAILISPDSWTDTAITLPVSADEQVLTLAGSNPDEPDTTLTLDPEVRFGSLQTVFDGQRSLLIATSNEAPDQLDELLRSLDGDGLGWSQLRGSAVVKVADRQPALVQGRTPESIYGPPGSVSQQEGSESTGNSMLLWSIAGGVVAAAVAIAVVIRRRARRSQPGSGDAGRHSDEKS
ncbi:MAG: cellulose biosynthesis cyclic di-GMP-binding regulatory protein BcsB [Actinomycetia bacterium]|nr:cellulose biosynthesis cyclic di-GMP-binding regulatory protein BcsB [Actinomycetes bacterium]